MKEQKITGVSQHATDQLTDTEIHTALTKLKKKVITELKLEMMLKDIKESIEALKNITITVKRKNKREKSIKNYMRSKTNYKNQAQRSSPQTLMEKSQTLMGKLIPGNLRENINKKQQELISITTNILENVSNNRSIPFARNATITSQANQLSSKSLKDRRKNKTTQVNDDWRIQKLKEIDELMIHRSQVRKQRGEEVGSHIKRSNTVQGVKQKPIGVQEEESSVSNYSNFSVDSSTNRMTKIQRAEKTPVFTRLKSSALSDSGCHFTNVRSRSNREPLEFQNANKKIPKITAFAKSLYKSSATMPNHVEHDEEKISEVDSSQTDIHLTEAKDKSNNNMYMYRFHGKTNKKETVVSIFNSATVPSSDEEEDRVLEVENEGPAQKSNKMVVQGRNNM